MPRVSIWLPDELHRTAKKLGLPLSELTQTAVAAEIERRHKVAELDAYLAELEAELGPAGDDERAEADAWAARLTASARGRKRRTA